MIVKYKKN